LEENPWKRLPALCPGLFFSSTPPLLLIRSDFKQIQVDTLRHELSVFLITEGCVSDAVVDSVYPPFSDNHPYMREMVGLSSLPDGISLELEADSGMDPVAAMAAPRRPD
jgi:hypothetical protein